MEAIRDISYLTPAAQSACRLFMEECQKNGLDIFITETYRSQERQNYLYSLGRTLPGKKVTWTKNSRHTSGRAWDIACRPPQALYDTDILKRCGDVAHELGITWGGDWSTPDTPHFEVDENYGMEDGSMTEAEKAKLQAIDESLTNLYSIVQGIVDSKRVYRSIDEVPEWARDDIAALVDSGVLRGDENGSLDLTDEMIRIIIVLKRML